MILAQSDMLFAEPTPDQFSGVSYLDKFQKPFIGKLSVGFPLARFLVELSYLHWTANQKLDNGGTMQTNALTYQALGLQLGWIAGSPRVFWVLGGGVYYPLTLKVANTEQSLTFVSSKKPLTFEGRVLLGVRFNSTLFMTLAGGYRYANFGDLRDGTASFVSGGRDFDFSGIFGSAGLGVTF